MHATTAMKAGLIVPSFAAMPITHQRLTVKLIYLRWKQNKKSCMYTIYSDNHLDMTNHVSGSFHSLFFYFH